ncbi:uncharacterized protein LOC105632363 [Jatropha curcas]|uniref:uncharacterized protein LOC105632363 n=1 Tax=Jatropha curcas TaxID=180498 RepID=UPI0018951B7B|nr:uncharacterized protein LOC105632363 [Jatropha curcas]
MPKQKIVNREFEFYALAQKTVSPPAVSRDLILISVNSPFLSSQHQSLSLQPSQTSSSRSGLPSAAFLGSCAARKILRRPCNDKCYSASYSTPSAESHNFTVDSVLGLSNVEFFMKEGLKISVGDCDVFKPPQEDSPPFVGIIRSLIVGEVLKLCVNWLYRPAELKLRKGIPLEAAPNEVFYSFHKDEILAASLLHPCKVSFLPKGVELPSRICSFVCRRVYDTRYKCFFWLTDQDYINERQEEVDQLLFKTCIEMHSSVQLGGHFPKPVNGSTSTSQLKLGSDDVHSGASSFAST